jgi:hypothetical protein
VLDLGLVQMRKLVLLGLRAEAQFINMIDDFAQIVSAGNLVPDLRKNLSDLIFDRVRPTGLLSETVQVRKELLVDEVAQIVAGHGRVVVQLAILALRRSPTFPPIRLVEDVGVRLALKLCLSSFVLL